MRKLTVEEIRKRFELSKEFNEIFDAFDQAIRQRLNDIELYRKVIEINLVGTFNVCRLAATAMSKNTPDADGCRGAIVAVGNHLPGNIPAEAMDRYMQYLGSRLAEGRER